MYNDIGISSKRDWERILHLFKLGLFGALLTLIGDMILGWGVEDETLTGLARMLSAYTGTSDGGILGYVIFGACGYHVPVCAMVFLVKHGVATEIVAKYAAYFLLPAFVLFWIFFLVLEITQIRAFAKGLTPYPRWCWVFSLPVGMVVAMALGMFGNYPLFNALSCAWICVGNVWMFGGLLAMGVSVSAVYKWEYSRRTS